MSEANKTGHTSQNFTPSDKLTYPHPVNLNFDPFCNGCPHLEEIGLSAYRNRAVSGILCESPNETNRNYRQYFKVFKYLRTCEPGSLNVRAYATLYHHSDIENYNLEKFQEVSE